MEGILYPMLLIPPPPVPLLFQNGVLHGVFVFGGAVGMVHEGDEFQEHALPTHAQFFTQMLAGKVVVLCRRKCALHSFGRRGSQRKRMPPQRRSPCPGRPR